MSAAETLLLQLLNKIIDDPYKNGTIVLKPLNSEGANYTSALYSASVTAKGKEDLKLFAKVANISSQFRNELNVELLFKTEQFVYSDLAKIYDNIQEKYNIDSEYRFLFPEYYGGDADEGKETVVLEDLVSKGYTPFSRFAAIDWEYAATVVESLARFHALSFAFAKEEPENFAKALEKLKYPLPKESEDPVAEETWKTMLDNAVRVCKEEHKEKISKCLFGAETLEAIFKYKYPLETAVICHGDYRMSNLLFRRENGQLKPMVLDYQTVHTGSCVADLLYLEFMGTDEQFRSEHHQRLVEHYFAELTRALERVGLDVNEVYPRETFDRELQETLTMARSIDREDMSKKSKLRGLMIPAVLLTASYILPLVLVESDQAPQLGGSGGVEVLALSPNELFAERFSGLVSDCVKWGAI